MPDAEGFVERRERDRFWLVAAEFADALEAIGWPSRAAIERDLGGAGSEGRGATAILALPGRRERVHLRPVRRGGIVGPLWFDTLWGLSRPIGELHASARLAAAGAPLARPVLVAAWRQAGPLWRAVVGTEHAEGALDGVAWLARRPAPRELRCGARAVGAAIRRFHDAGGEHADLHVKNLLVRERSGTCDALLIDLDRARADAPPGPARRMRELMRLVRSLHKRGLAEQVGARGVAAGFGAYCSGDRTLRRVLLAHLPRERRRAARHALRYR